MRNPNGYGSVVKLSGKRRKPYMAYITSFTSEGVIILEEDKSLLEAKLEALKGASEDDMWDIAKEIISLTQNDTKEYLVSLCESLIKKETYKAKQVKHPLGYFATQKEAQVCLAEYNKGRTSVDAIEMTFGEAYEQAYASKGIKDKSKSTQGYWENATVKLSSIWNKALRKISLQELQDIMSQYNETSLSTQRNLLIVIRATFEYGMQNDAIAKDYSKFISVGKTKEVRKKSPYTREEIAMLWEKQDTDKLIMIYTGMRAAEYTSLTKEDINIEERIITVKGTKTKNATRMIPIHKDILPVMSEWNGSLKSYNQLTCNFDANHTSHDCRHSFVTYTYGMNEALRKYIVGHSGDLTQDVYTHPEILKKELVAEIDKIEFR